MYSLKVSNRHDSVIDAVAMYIEHMGAPIREMSVAGVLNEKDAIFGIPSGTIYHDNIEYIFKNSKENYATGAYIDKYYELEMKGSDMYELKQIIHKSLIHTRDMMNNRRIEHGIENYTYTFGWNPESKVSKRSLDTLYLPSKLTTGIVNDMKEFISDSTKEWYNSKCIPYRRIYMLHGPPGTGKTSLITALATQFDMNICSLDMEDINDYVFRKSIRTLPKGSILLMEDVDSIFTDKTHMSFSGFLNALDGISPSEQVITMMTTNHINKLDQAVVRRVDYLCKFDYASKKQLNSLYENLVPEGNFEELYENIPKKCTTNILQKHILKHKSHEKILKNAHEMKEYIDDIESRLYT